MHRLLQLERFRAPPAGHATSLVDLTALQSVLRALKLSGMLETLDARLAQAHAGDLGHLDFLQILCQDEITRRDTNALARRLHRARFEQQATFEGFDFNTSPKRRLIHLIATVNGGSLLVSISGSPRYANGWPDPVVILGAAWLAFAASWSLGTAARTRREFAAREARRQAEQAAADERLRIARELHDVVAHSMSVITVKAGVAAKVLDKHPEEGRKALRAIEEIGRGSLAEMRHLLGVLREPGSAPDSAPLPRLADLPSLARQAAEAGVQVDLSVDGTVPDSMAPAVYRIVQEAITNVVKHAAPAHCQASVSVADGRLRISVVDDGPGQRVLPGRPGGHGLAGMRERTLLYGGTFEAGPLSGTGFGVHASWEIP
ncbi:histidine kinase [Nonomuraea sp. B1E8]|uniref:histidine kinase n=1 Tax=unclassified Nonomuraea TaxID=2593643 RepID=UPI00325F11E4